MAGYLLDSNAYIWFKTGSPKLAPQALAAIEARENKIFLSLASLWEMAIKVAQGRLDEFAELFSRGATAIDRALRDSDIDLLMPNLADVLRSTALPRHHLDPFDRMIIAQAEAENLTVITRDRMFARYGVRILAA